MVNLITTIIMVFVITLIGGGGAYLLYLRTRPKKEIWQAKVYQLMEGVRTPKVNKKGVVVSNIQLQDLKPYGEDTLERIKKGPGEIDIFRLQKLNKATPPVGTDVVEYWGKGKREVSILLLDSGVTLLKKGYDKLVGEIIYTPLPFSRINMIKSEMAIRKDRLHKEKDILQAITPWIVTGICVLGLIALAYVQVEGFVKMSEDLKISTGTIVEMQERLIKHQSSIAGIQQGVVQEPHDLGSQPPVIDGSGAASLSP